MVIKCNIIKMFFIAAFSIFAVSAGYDDFSTKCTLGKRILHFSPMIPYLCDFSFQNLVMW